MLPYGSGRPSSVSAKGGAAMKDHRPLLDKGRRLVVRHLQTTCLCTFESGAPNVR